jgi:hypothetical protein
MEWLCSQKFWFDTSYKGGLSSLMLYKQLVHMYVVELGSILIWKYTKFVVLTICLKN